MRTEQMRPAAGNGSGRGEEQRVHVRFVCAEGSVLRLAVRPTFRGHRALLCDISVGGVGLLMAQPLEVGTCIAVDLQDPTEEGVTRLARVAHARPRRTPADAPWLPKSHPFKEMVRWFFGKQPAAPEVCWFMGCRFDTPLTDEQLARLIPGTLFPDPGSVP